MSNGRDTNQLLELSRHYDTMLWAVTSLWAGVVGGLLAYSGQVFDTWLAVFGLGLTVGAMYFAYSFRVLRRSVHEQLPEDLKKLVTAGGGFRQWDALGLLFLSLVVLWTRLLILNSCGHWLVWVILGVIAAALIGAMWRREH